jgi:uncharacterized membrane protein YqaE (UPF0057 family)
MVDDKRVMTPILRIILGILLPPLGIFLTYGFGTTLIINILLTLLGWLPGSIHAVWAIAKHEEKLNSEREIPSS